MKKLLITLIIILPIVYCSENFSQNSNAQINFKMLEHNFGEIEENQGPVSYEFVFSNDGTLPLVLGNVQPSCGCTTPEWTREPIVPGKLGSINVKFDPRGRPGPFTKSITVNSNAETNTVVLKITGYVKGIKKPFSEFRYSMGDLRLENIHAAFGSIIKGTKQKKDFEIANASTNNPLSVSFRNVPDHLLITVSPMLIKPGEKGIIQVEFNSNKLDDWDYIVDRLELLVNNEKVSNDIFTVTAVVKEDFSKLTSEDLLKAPKIAFSEEKINFGNLEPNQKIENNYTVMNNGQTDLIIRKVRASCGCTIVQPSKKVISPGQTTTIKAIFNSTGKSGEQKYAITVISNDPRNYKKLLWLEGNVIKHE